MISSVERDRKISGVVCLSVGLLVGLTGCASEVEPASGSPGDARPSSDVTKIARDEATTILTVAAPDPGQSAPTMDMRSTPPVATDCDPRGEARCGTPSRCEVDCTKFIDIESRLSLLSQDIARVPTSEDRKDVRYLDLSSYANAGSGERVLEKYRAALGFLLNSLSSAPIVRPLLAVDDQRLLFRIRLSDLGWSANTWERIASFYPYDVRYDPGSRTFPVTESYAERLREATGTTTPYIQADWFFSHAVRPPLYYDILGLPTAQPQLEAQLAVSTLANVAGGRAARAGFQRSGESRFNRIVERHPLGPRGALWLAHDFASGTGTANALTHPLDFQATSRQLALHLPNGLFAFAIVDALGTRLDRALSGGLQDPGARDLSMEAGISCLSCHAEQGVLAVRDEARTAASLTTSDPAVLAQVHALYPEPAALDPLLAQDQERHVRALALCQAADFTGADVHLLDREHKRLLGVRDVAGILGITAVELLTALDATPRIFPTDILALRRSDARLPRENFDAVLPDLVVALGLGQVARRP